MFIVHVSDNDHHVRNNAFLRDDDNARAETGVRLVFLSYIAPTLIV